MQIDEIKSVRLNRIDPSVRRAAKVNVIKSFLNGPLQHLSVCVSENTGLNCRQVPIADTIMGQI